MSGPDPFDTLMTSRRPLVPGIGGGGDAVGAYATAEILRRYQGAEPIIGSLTWERLPLDPHPGPRRAEEIEGARELAPGVLLAGAHTRVRGTDIHFAESRMAALTGAATVLVDIHGGPGAVAASLAVAMAALDCDALVLLDVGGDVLVSGDEPGLGSPLCDALMLAAGALVQADGAPVVSAIFGLGCDGELTIPELAARLGELGRAGALSGALGLTASVAESVRSAAALVGSEASALPERALHGEESDIVIRGGRRRLRLTPAAALTVFFDPGRAVAAAAPLARALSGAPSLEEANAILNSLGLHTELDYERQTSQRLATSTPESS